MAPEREPDDGGPRPESGPERASDEFGSAADTDDDIDSDGNLAGDSDTDDDASTESAADTSAESAAVTDTGESPLTTTVGPMEIPISDDDPPGIDPLDERLPPLTLDSRWWYWIAAVPVYFVVSTLAGFVAFFVAFVALAADFGPALFGLFLFLFVVIALPGLILSVMFPLAMYADARAIAGADLEWTPDPILYGLLALAAMLMTAFTLSVPLALYYLYQRHRRVGVP